MPYIVVHEGKGAAENHGAAKKMGGKATGHKHLAGQVYELSPKNVDRDAIDELANVSYHEELPPED